MSATDLERFCHVHAGSSGGIGAHQGFTLNRGCVNPIQAKRYEPIFAAFAAQLYSPLTALARAFGQSMSAR
jgi:hypothetical protein